MPLTVRDRAILALLMGVPLMSLGVIASLVLAPGIIGQSVLVICQICLISLPVVWRRWVERKPLSVSRPRRSDWMIGTALGLLMSCIILAAYGLFLRHWIDADSVRETLQTVGDLNRASFLLGGVYFIFVNALIEEYFWRWFVFSRCEELTIDSSGKAAVLLSALFFTLHHAIGLAAFATGWRVVVVGSLAVFVAGAVWSECYRRRRSVWSNYASHAIADIALHVIAWQVFFG